MEEINEVFAEIKALVAKKGYDLNVYINDCRIIVSRGKKLVAKSLSSRVLQYDLQGNLIAEYESLKAAAQASGVSRTAISQCVNGKLKGNSGKKYIWRYK